MKKKKSVPHEEEGENQGMAVAAGADVLGFGVNLVGAFKTDNGGQAHVEAPHHPPFL